MVRALILDAMVDAVADAAPDAEEATFERLAARVRACQQHVAKCLALGVGNAADARAGP